MRDYFGKDASVLKTKKLFLFDMDGTIYRENDLFDGVILLLEKIENEGGQVCVYHQQPFQIGQRLYQKIK